jgi:hypothetical protein
MKTNTKHRFKQIIAVILYVLLPTTMIFISPVLVMIWLFTGYSFSRFIDEFLDWYSLIMAGNQHARIKWRQE